MIIITLPPRIYGVLSYFGPLYPSKNRQIFYWANSGRHPSFSDRSEIAAGGIAFIVSYLQHARINCFTLSEVEGSSLWLSHPVASGIVSVSFRIWITSPDITSVSGVTTRPLPSAVWTFLPVKF